MRKYTLQELADLTGLTHGYVRDLECLSIDKTPLLETIGKFADALEIDIRQLFDDSNQYKTISYFQNYGIIKIDFVSFNRMILFCWEENYDIYQIF